MKRQLNFAFFIVLVVFNIAAVTARGSQRPKLAETENSAVIKLGYSTDFEKIGKVLLANPKAWGPSGRDGTITYRKLRSNAVAEVLFAAFGVDENGLCKHDAILEILYRDDIKKRMGKRQFGEDKIQGDVLIRSRLDFSGNNQFLEVGNLYSAGDGKWKVANIFLERTLRQMIRAIDGSFQFKIEMPAPKGVGLPIAYIKLRMVTHEELVRLREKDRAARGWGLKRVEFEPESPSRKAFHPECSFAVYPVNYLELVFPKSSVRHARIGKALECFEVPGEAEPLTFVIHAYEDLQDVRVVTSDLHSETGFISVENVDVRRVIYNDQRWGWSIDKHYGKCPDYLGFKDPVVNIKANSNCQFWLTIDIPKNVPAGLYKSKIMVYIKNKDPYTIPLLVEVLPIKLLTNQVKHMIWYSPYFMKAHRDPIRVLEDMKKHHVVPIFYPTRNFEEQLKSFRKVYPDTKELFIDLSDYHTVWYFAKGPEPQFVKPFPKFNLAYGKSLKKLDDLAKKYGLEFSFSFNEEPFKNIKRRRIAYLCSLIAQSNGLKTWSTHNLNDDVQLQLTEDEIRSNVNYLRPLREVLDIFVEAVIRINETTIKTLKESGANLSYYTTYLATSVRPVYNRLLHGIYPFVTNSKFVLCYSYHHERADPYDDMDVAVDHPQRVGAGDYLLTYPTWRGDILPTIPYEALREGVEDSHLISTMKILAHQASQAIDPKVVELGKEAEDYLNGVLKKLSKNFEQRYWKIHKDLPVDPTEKAILKDLNGEANVGYDIFDEIRRGICDRIVRLQNCDEVKRKMQLLYY